VRGVSHATAELQITLAFPPGRKGRASVKASASGAWSPEAKPLAAGFGDGSGVPNGAKPAEPLAVQPGAWVGSG
jgi:hypothetical protein